MIRKLISLIYPPKCAVCREIVTENGKAALCGNCLAKWRKERSYFKSRSCPSGTDGLISLVNYSKTRDSAGKRMVLLAKDRRNDALYSFFARELYCAITSDGGRFDVLTYVPRSPEKILDTGTDQSEEIAKRLAKQLKIPFVRAVRCTGKQEQKKLDKGRRYENAKSRFLLARGAGSRLEGKRVLLFDDIITTGASLSACADILKSQCGAVKVICITVASSDPGSFDS